MKVRVFKMGSGRKWWIRTRYGSLYARRTWLEAMEFARTGAQR